MLIDELPADMPMSERRRVRMLEAYRVRRDPTSESARKSELSRASRQPHMVPVVSHRGAEFRRGYRPS